MYLLYWIFKPLIYLTWKTVYKIRFIGKQNIDFSKPTLIVANHTNSVIDPVAIAVNIRKGVYFLARGDAFANNFLDWLLSQFHLLPIYRKSEFADNQEKNKEVFDRVFDILDRNHPIIIFSEGTCVQQKIIRPFKKGTAHIAVEYAIRHNDWNKLQILPIGLNYHIYNRFNDDLLQHVGEPFTLQDIGITNADDKSIIDKITQEAEQTLAKTLILQPIEALQGMEIPIETIVKRI
ncbi:MAG: 1-acyl-sn-glycerol-3-phosphate acyltransferase [Saprospirales bacterium]|nr:1-acyl-sn-glycerol-3-phosphate acyltransferase [Saprospirales bacterium]